MTTSARRLGVLNVAGSAAFFELAPIAAYCDPSDRRYAAIAIISGLSIGSGLPFMLRCMHSLMRSSMSVWVPWRPEKRG